MQCQSVGRSLLVLAVLMLGASSLWAGGPPKSDPIATVNKSAIKHVLGAPGSDPGNADDLSRPCPDLPPTHNMSCLLRIHQNGVDLDVDGEGVRVTSVQVSTPRGGAGYGGANLICDLLGEPLVPGERALVGEEAISSIPARAKVSYVLDPEHPIVLTRRSIDSRIGASLEGGGDSVRTVSIRACAERNGHRWSKDFRIFMAGADGGVINPGFHISGLLFPAVPSIFARAERP